MNILYAYDHLCGKIIMTVDIICLFFMIVDGLVKLFKRKD